MIWGLTRQTSNQYMIKMVKLSFARNSKTIFTLSGLKMSNQGLRSKLKKRPLFSKKSPENSKRSMKKRKRSIKKLSKKPNKRPSTIKEGSEKTINLVIRKVETTEIASPKSHMIEEATAPRRNLETTPRLTGTKIGMNTTTGVKTISTEIGLTTEMIEDTTSVAIITIRMSTAGVAISLLVREIKGITMMITGGNIETSLDQREMTIGEGKSLALHTRTIGGGSRALMIRNTTKIEGTTAKMKGEGKTSGIREDPAQGLMETKIMIGKIQKITKISAKTIGKMTEEIVTEATIEKKTSKNPNRNAEMIMIIEIKTTIHRLRPMKTISMKMVNQIGDQNKKILLKKAKLIRRKNLSMHLRSLNRGLNKDLKIKILTRKNN